jgi:hypothetical protein
MQVVSIVKDFPCFPADIAPLGAVCCIWDQDSVLYEHMFSPYALDIVSDNRGGTAITIGKF